MYGRTPGSPWQSAAKIAPCSHTICYHHPQLRTQWCPAAAALFCPSCYEDGLRPFYTEGQTVKCARMPALDPHSTTPSIKKPKLMPTTPTPPTALQTQADATTTLESAATSFLTASRNRTGTNIWSANALALFQQESRALLYGPPSSYPEELTHRLATQLCCKICTVLITDCTCCQDCGRDIKCCSGRCNEAIARLKEPTPTAPPTATTRQNV